MIAIFSFTANDADGLVEILCGKPFQELKEKIAREILEARERELDEKEELNRRKEDAEKVDAGEGSGIGSPDGVTKANGTTEATTPTAVHTGHSDISEF